VSKTVGKFRKEKYYDDEYGEYSKNYSQSKKRKIEDAEVRKQMRKRDYKKLRMDDLEDKYY
jgi:hypothetical protein